MTASTTLMTFMVRAPQSTRMVALYGSWDNFSAPYPMSRDIRLGPEHWSGCHSFENIICDGNVEETARSRKGGLKMGGTYWYYYKLDDEIEFHNSAEPSTTRCPLLPGQLVNVLQVPFALCSSRNRDASVSSTSSERRTLDPEAKFMNPRPVPSPPQLVRLNSSPTLPRFGEIANSSPLLPKSANLFLKAEVDASAPTTPARVFHLPRKPSLDALLKVASAKPNPAGLRQAFKTLRTGRSRSPEARYRDIVNWQPEEIESLPNDSNRDIPEEVFEMSSNTGVEVRPRAGRPRPPRGALLLRSNSDDVVTLSSFGEHRRQQSRSRSRGGSSRNSLVWDESGHLDLTTKQVVESGPLSTLMEVNSPERTPGYGPTTGRRMALEALEGRKDNMVQLEKRLPTLPNTPSSAYPPSFKDNSPPRSKLQVMGLDSRFSATTIDTTCHLDSIILDEQQRKSFMDWAAIPEMSPCSATSFEESRASLAGTDESDENIFETISLSPVAAVEDFSVSSERSPRIMSSVVQCTTVNTGSSETPSIMSEDDGEIIDVGDYPSSASSIRSSGTRFGHIQQHYCLPDYENASEVTLKQYNSSDRNLAAQANRTEYRNQPAPRHSNLSHSEGMQQLLDELSYLSSLIQN